MKIVLHVKNVGKKMKIYAHVLFKVVFVLIIQIIPIPSIIHFTLNMIIKNVIQIYIQLILKIFVGNQISQKK